MYKTRRQQRSLALKDAHFLPFERIALSKINFSVPYMKPLIKKRNSDYDQFIADGGRDSKWGATMRKRYKDNGWYKVGGGWNRTVAFRMLKSVEKEWKYKHPAYDSPWEKRRKSPASILAKLDATYEKYPRGKTYTKRQQPRRIEHLPEGGARFID